MLDMSRSYDMNLDQLYPYGFRPTLFDRLASEYENTCNGLSIQQLRESVAHDLEDLLNSRVAAFNQDIQDYSCVKNSILQFGIIDFVGLSTANPLDRDKICQAIEQAITAYEPRLRHIKVGMLLDHHNMGGLCLSIQAYLNIYPIYEPVIFDALLKPTTQQYLISTKT